MPIITSGVQYSGIWNLSSQANAKALGTWPAAYNTFSLYAWGTNTSGQLGIGNTTSKSSPNQVGSLTNWLKIAGDGYINLAVKTDGTMWSWGTNSIYQLSFTS